VVEAATVTFHWSNLSE